MSFLNPTPALFGQRSSVRVRGETVEVFNYDQRCELEADRLAFKWVLGATPRKLGAAGFVLAAPLLLCSFFGALDHIRHCISENDPASGTHPSGFIRFDELMKTFRGKIPPTAVTLAVGFHRSVLRALMDLDSCNLEQLAVCVAPSR